MNTYDVAVIGAGATGASIAWQLSHYNLKVALLDRCADASFGVSKANSGIVHGGFHHSADSTLKAKLELEGNPMFDDLQKELDFEFNRCGILVVAYSDEELPQLQKLYERDVCKPLQKNPKARRLDETYELKSYHFTAGVQ